MKKRIIVGAIAAALSIPAFAADPVLEKMEKQIAELQKQIAELKATQSKEADARKELANQVEAQSKEVALKGDIPGSTRRAGEETSVRVYGFARMDAVHNFGGQNSRGNGGDWGAYQPNIALTGSDAAERRGETYMHARTSRLGVEAFTPTKHGSLNTKLEADFYADGGTGIFRLRHAYGQLGSWLIGQTWSTFMDLDSSPETVDFNGPTGNTSLRQPQVRYTYVTPSAGNFIAALETKGTGSDAEKGTNKANTISRVPDLVLRWEKASDWGHVAVRGVTTENAVKGAYYDESSPAVKLGSSTASKRGYGLGLGGSFKATDTTTLLASSTYGTGMGRFFNDSVGAVVSAANNSIYLPTELGMVFAVHQKLSDTLRGSVTYGQQRTFGGEYIKAAGGGTNRFVQSGTVGLIWAPVANVELGSEFMLSRRETLDGRSGTEPRLNFAATYAFGN